MKNIFLLSISCVLLLYNCNCGSGTKENIVVINQDSLRILDSIRQGHFKDSIYTDSLNKAANIEVKKVELPPDVQKQVNVTILAQEEGSFLKGKTESEIFSMYEAFTKKYDPKNKTHRSELKKWTDDRLFQELKNKEAWVEKIEELDAAMQAKK